MNLSRPKMRKTAQEEIAEMMNWANQMGYRNIGYALLLVLRDLKEHGEGTRPIVTERN